MRTITPIEVAKYRQTARRRREAAEQQCRQRWERAWRVARQAATLLRGCFHAQKIVVFGSLLRPDHFGCRSDVDLAVWGVGDDVYLQAVAAVTGLDGEITVDLIAMEQAQASLCQTVDREGVAI